MECKRKFVHLINSANSHSHSMIELMGVAKFSQIALTDKF
jgi:hypothetical protein